MGAPEVCWSFILLSLWAWLIYIPPRAQTAVSYFSFSLSSREITSISCITLCPWHSYYCVSALYCGIEGSSPWWQRWTWLWEQWLSHQSWQTYLFIYSPPFCIRDPIVYWVTAIPTRESLKILTHKTSIGHTWHQI